MLCQKVLDMILGRNGGRLNPENAMRGLGRVTLALKNVEHLAWEGRYDDCVEYLVQLARMRPGIFLGITLRLVREARRRGKPEDLEWLAKLWTEYFERAWAAVREEVMRP